LNGETLKRRPDDADAMAVVKRIDTYLENTMPLLGYYREKGLVYDVDAEQDIAAVSEAIKQILDSVR
jgi:adenylate kinase